VIHDLLVADLDAGELGLRAWAVSLHDFRFRKRCFPVLRDEDRIVSNSFLKELRIWAKLGLTQRSSIAAISASTGFMALLAVRSAILRR
jgi:hypothetical protein